MRSLVTLFALGLCCIGDQAQAALDITLIGPPGSGKGTLGVEITRVYGLPRISTGDLVRAEVSAGTPFGTAVKSVIEAGGLIQDGTPLSYELLNKVKQVLSSPKYVNGAIFDGYPRTRWQADQLEKMLSSIGRKITIAPELVVPRDVLLARTEGRLICQNCGLSYHKVSRPPVADMTCDKCCGALTRRKDDAREVSEKRIDRYEADVAELLAFYRERGVLRTLDGTQGVDAVLKTLSTAIDPAGILDRNYLSGLISSYPGPKPDVPRMYNIVEIYEHPELFKSVSERMAEVVTSLNIDYIAAPEARGWGLAGAVALLTGKPLISIRKVGKLPRGADLGKVDYGTAYSKDSIEMIKKAEYIGKSAIILDDGNSSGGTALAVRDLLAQSGLNATGIMTVIKYHYKESIPQYRDWINQGGIEVSYYDLK